ncbi:hypothetical protein P875_00022143 [Aspergillus parasiticus SU-1]|uniref:Uncharacterized protein n=1 Tax=Aspergillus parasiticus (strain ATCC 56775 / NRRL 5862 / SRRC 143 / SU-1) TaxID=1403190 RepID=A0A0F0IG54_ASPPU|nr:hypothetical protein P875_00022143 [Aspergillus parasiticus SU-1]
MSPLVATDDFTSAVVGEMTLVLSTSETPYEIGKNFHFTTRTCLIYAEHVRISDSLKFPGKDLGIFCYSLQVTKSVDIDVSGKSGSAGLPATGADEEGERGADGADAGNIWIFVQDFNEKLTQELRVKAFGGDGGHGGNSTGPGKKGGDGGNGGNGGSIEFVYGTKAMKSLNAAGRLYSQPWPEAALNLSQDVTGTGLPDLVQATNKPIVELYRQVSELMSRLITVLGDFEDNHKDVQPVRELLVTNLKSVNAPKTVSDSSVQELEQALQKLNDNDVDGAIKLLQVSLVTLQPASGSMLTTIVLSVVISLQSTVASIKRSVVAMINNTNAGVGAVGGINSNYPSAPSGNTGKDGQTDGARTAENLPFDGSEKDAASSQAYAFPDQCQMLLNKADKSFFANTTAQRERASGLYQRIIARLAFLTQLEKQDKSSSLDTAYEALEKTWKVTISPIIELRSIRTQAENRFNRLILGQDMFGHSPDWAPRLSFDYYKEEVERELADLKDVVRVTDNYLKALEEGRATEKLVAEGINSMIPSYNAAESKIQLLTSSNGPLATNAFKIATFTPLIEEKRANIQQRLSNVTVHSTSDPRMVLDALATLTSIKPSFSSLVDLSMFGYDAYKSTTVATDVQGNKFNKAYVIDQLATCGDTLLSLSTSYETRKDKTIAVDDPSCIKILTSVDNIKSILNQFKGSIEEQYRKELSDALDDYVDTILMRNDAILEYNAAIQLLFEAESDRQYYLAQAEKLGGEGIKVNPDLPAIVFWLRKTEDSFRLSLMQHLNYEAAAIRFWGLLDDIPLLEPGSLPSYTYLQSSQAQLLSAFERSLERYATSVRTKWPTGNDVGLLYQLSNDVVEQLKMRKPSASKPGQDIHTAVISLPEHAIPFAGRADIRLNQVRLWLFPVTLDASDGLGRKFLSIQLIHTGNEMILDDDDTSYKFTHDAVYIDFEYNVDNIKELPDIQGAEVRGEQQIQGDHTMGTSTGKSAVAALGPFTKWQVMIKTSNVINKGLNLDNLKEAHMEFWGTNRPSRVRHGDDSI